MMDNNWQENMSMKAANLHMLQNEVFCDITFLVGQHKQRQPAHRYMLVSRSPVFFAMFCGPLAECSDVIEIPDIEPATLKQLLRFIYTEECDITEEEVMSLLYAARKYEVTGLRKKCSDFLSRGISNDTACTILLQGVVFDEKILIDTCLTYIFENASNVLSSEDFLSLDKDSLKLIVQSDFLKLGEEEVYNACIKWAKQECLKQEIEESVDNVSIVLGDILYLIRFPIMSVDTFQSLVPEQGLLSREEFTGVLKDLKEETQKLECTFNYRFRLDKKPFLFSRFDKADILDGWSYENDKPDALSFSCSRDVYLAGFSLFTPCSTGLSQGTLDLLEGDRVIHSETHHIILAYMKQKYDDIMFEPVILLRKDVIYTLKLCLRGQNTFYGCNASVVVSQRHTGVTFHDSPLGEVGSNISQGQFHGIYLHI